MEKNTHKNFENKLLQIAQKEKVTYYTRNSTCWHYSLPHSH